MLIFFTDFRLDMLISVTLIKKTCNSKFGNFSGIMPFNIFDEITSFTCRFRFGEKW